jgi:6-pyruvoyltetrahydropterin/6-carboxytetrahydropterin synthase
MSAYTSSKQFELGSTAFRQWRADHSHCRFIHGYQLKAELTFGCKSLDDKNWCVDFGGLDILKQTLRNHFDHTLVAAGDDPEITTFQDLDSKGILQLRIMNEGVGVEKFAEYVYKTADAFVDEASEGRCFVVKAKVTEHEDNWAEYTKEDKEASADHECCQATTETTPDPEPEPEPEPEPPNQDPGRPQSGRQGAQVGPNVSPGKGNWFAGTTWGD